MAKQPDIKAMGAKLHSLLPFDDYSRTDHTSYEAYRSKAIQVLAREFDLSLMSVMRVVDDAIAEHERSVPGMKFQESKT